MKVLDLFSGIGGCSLGLSWAGFNTVAFCEIDKYCQKVLNKNFPNVPIFKDIKELTLDSFRSEVKDESKQTIDLVCGGFP